jgi:hypothetical protein
MKSGIRLRAIRPHAMTPENEIPAMLAVKNRKTKEKVCVEEKS